MLVSNSNGKMPMEISLHFLCQTISNLIARQAFGCPFLFNN